MIPFWDRDQLRHQLRPIDFSRPAELSEIESRYCQYYRIDKETRISGISHRLGSMNSLEFSLALHIYSPPRPRGAVFVLHGYFDHVGLYGHLIEWLLRENFSVVAYDQPGHGLSSGEPVSIRSFDQYTAILEDCLKLCKGKVPEPWLAVGQSTGAAVLTELMFRHRFTPESSPFIHWCLLAPLVRPAGWRAVVLLHSLLGGLLRTWRRTWQANSSDHEFLGFLKEHDPLQAQSIAIDWVGALRKWVHRMEGREPLDLPVTIVQGKQDTTVDWPYNLKILGRLLPRAQVLYLEDARHHLVNESESLRKQVFTRMATDLVAAAEAYHRRHNRGRPSAQQDTAASSSAGNPAPVSAAESRSAAKPVAPAPGSAPSGRRRQARDSSALDPEDAGQARGRGSKPRRKTRDSAGSGGRAPTRPSESSDDGEEQSGQEAMSRTDPFREE